MFWFKSYNCNTTKSNYHFAITTVGKLAAQDQKTSQMAPVSIVSIAVSVATSRERKKKFIKNLNQGPLG